MTLDQIAILATGTGAILFIYWYFFGKQERAVKASGSVVNVSVDAGYNPATIQVKKGQSVTLKIHRIDPSNCLDQLIIPEWSIVKALPLNKEIEVTFTPEEVGEFPFHCGMNMFHGKIIVKE